MSDPHPDALTIEIQTGPHAEDTTRVMIVGLNNDHACRIAAIRESALGQGVLVVDAGEPTARDPDMELGPIAGLMGRAIAAALSGPTFADVLVPIKQKPKQTRAEWRRQMKGRR